MKRTLLFTNPYHLGVANRQLRAEDKHTGEVRSVPVEDIGCIVLEHPQLTFTQRVVQLLVEHNAAVVFCDAKRYPCSMLLHLDSHYLQTERFAVQIHATTPRKKQLWQQIVKAKIANQAALLDQLGMDATAVRQQVRKVKSGDADNAEARAARLYWPLLFGKTFTRERFGKAPNPALNYGYAVLRAAVARALAGSGLTASIGLHHRNRYNAFCLADDVMEPYRPHVDRAVYDMQREGVPCDKLEKQAKERLLSVLYRTVANRDTTGPLMAAITHTAASLVRCLEQTRQRLVYPRIA